MNNKDLYGKALIAYKKVNEGDLSGALDIANSIKSNSYYGAFLASGILINIGNIQMSEDLVVEGIELLKKDFELIKNMDPLIASAAHYNLANGYSSLYNFKKKNYSHYVDIELHKAKFHYRKALENNPGIDLKVQIYTNLANCFDNIGRVLDGLEYYENALELNPKHPMALGNKGVTLKNFASLIGRHPDTFLIEAYSLLSEALSLELPIEAKKSFNITLKNIESKFPNKDKLKTPREYPGCKIPDGSEFDMYYNKFCLNEKLYLNICNYCQKCDAALGDTLLIQHMTVPLSNELPNEHLSPENDQFLRLSSYLNQIKQDYVATKFLLVLSQYQGVNLDFVDKNVRIIDTYDYQVNNIYIQLIKLSFKNLYDILDKIAIFVNDYFELGDDPNYLNFDNIWYNKKKTLIKEKIIKSKNPGLRALFDIHKDLNKDGDYYSLKKMRNALTHRFIYVKMFCEEENEENMKEETLTQRTIELAKLVRSAVIYLIYSVHQEENKKMKKNKDLPSLIASEVPDHLKSDRTDKIE